MNGDPPTKASAPGEVPLPQQHSATDLPASGVATNPAATGGSTAGGDHAVSPGQPAANTLSKEEQWVLFEKELKENDWGHQPC